METPNLSVLWVLAWQRWVLDGKPGSIMKVVFISIMSENCTLESCVRPVLLQ
jgi:hypothetical protein